MNSYSRSHLSDQALLHSLATSVGRERTATAGLLADLAEVDARKLYLPAAYPSMFAYCLGELRLSQDGAAKRIHAARAARRFPAIFEAVADGRLHLSGVCLLASHLTEETAAELLSAATHKSKAEIEQLLAERFPQPDVLAWATPNVAPSSGEHAREHSAVSPGTVAQHAPGHVQPVHDGAKVTPLSTQSYAVQFTMSQGTHEKLRYVQTLLGRQVPSGDIADLFEQALDAWIPQLEKRRFSATTKPRHGKRASTNPRYVPAHVQRAVWQRDGGQCPPARAVGREHDETDDLDVVPWLRALGFSAAEARRAAERCDDMPDASIEERVRVALTCFRVRGTRVVPEDSRLEVGQVSVSQ